MYSCRINTDTHFIARKSSQFFINHYDHTIIRYTEDSPYDTDPAVNSQLTENNSMKTEYIFHVDSTNEKS